MSQEILVLDCHVHTLTVIRSLSRAGYQVTLGVTADELNRGFVHVSQLISSTWLHPDIVDDPAGFDTALLVFLERNPQLKLIFPVGENSVREIASIRAAIPPGVLIAMPENEAVEICLNKARAYRVAEKCQIPVPETRTVNSTQELCAAINELGFPSIVKASDSTSLLLGKKCVFVRTRSDLEALVDKWPDSQDDFVVQNEIKGLRYNCDVVAENGLIQLYFESEILRTDQADYAGNSVFDRSVRPSTLHKDYCERFVADLNYTGLALIQFLRDEHTGESNFLEANPRAGSTIALAVHCGIDLPAASLRAHIGNSSDSDKRYPINRAQNWLHGDLLGLRKARINREVGLRQSFVWLSKAVADFIRADCHASFVWRDPKPTMKLYWSLFARLFNEKRRDGDS